LLTAFILGQSLTCISEFVLVFLAGKAWHGTNQGKIALEWLTERAVKPPVPEPAWQHHCVPTSRCAYCSGLLSFYTLN